MDILSPSKSSLKRAPSLLRIQLEEDALSPFVERGAKGSQKSGSHIILPSRSIANDSSRNRNLGSPKAGHSGRIPRPSSAPSRRLHRSVSAPSMPICKSMTALDPNTPRSQRGLIRRASKTSISYPSLPVYVDVKDLHKCRRNGNCKPAVPSHHIGTPVASKRPSSAPAGKRVSFTDEVEFIDPKAQALRRSKTLLSTLFALRRAGLARNENESKDAPEQTGGETSEDTLMNTTLSDVNDDSKSLQQTLTHLENAQEPVHDAGGARHASTLVAARTLGVVRRKLFLVQALEKRLAEFQNAVDQNQVILSEMLASESDPPLVQSLLGIPQFLKSYIHKDGQPTAADKTDFEAFTSSFGLPSKHQLAMSFRHLAEEATNWWASSALREAESGVDANTILRILAVASGINGIHNQWAMQECHTILHDRLAKEVLALAEKLQKKDSDTALLSKEPQPQSAKDKAAEINQEITRAVKHGASPKHACMEKAKGIAIAFSTEEKKRYALKALRFAEKAQARDRENVEKATDGVPEVGPASEQADLIDKEVNRAIRLGATESDPALKEASAIAKALRDADGERKRMKARQKRLASTATSS